LIGASPNPEVKRNQLMPGAKELGAYLGNNEVHGLETSRGYCIPPGIDVLDSSDEINTR
jgi:hypothetical protein